MSYKKKFSVAICLLLCGTIMGCPNSGSIAISPCKIFFDDNCDHTDDSVNAMFLNADGSLEYIADGVVKEGTWSVVEDTFRMRIKNYLAEEDLNGDAKVEMNTFVHGKYTVGLAEGCFRAVKVILTTQ